jgi:sugar phosphate isomerase/epimerase
METKLTNNIPIGISSTNVYPSPVSKAFEVASRLGYDGVEIMVTQSPNSRSVENLKMLEDKYETKVLSIHAPNLILTRYVWGRSHHNKMAKTVELAQNMGIDTIVVHPPMRTQRKHANEFFDNVFDLENNTGIKIAVENMFPWRVKNKTVEVYKPSWEDITKTVNHLTIDFSHAALSGLDSLQIVKNNLHKISHIHLCDGKTTTGYTDTTKDKVMDEHALPGYGDQPVAEVLNFLAQEKWGGKIIAEVNLRKMKSSHERLKALKETLDFAKLHTQ